MTDTYGTKHKPTEIRVNQEAKTLEVDFDNGKSFCLTAELLRVESPSAEIQGHGPGQKTIIGGRRHVGIMGVEPVGNYAIKINFDDLHDTGIFSWDTLYDYGQRQDELWQNYLDALAEKEMSRDP
ncbi:MAG: DUF971 domain-containing protein [Rhodospirillales bacterium]|nr:DUF971 domain-containing protein [Rhodospirillales bacterium]